VDETRIRGVADSELFDYGADISRLVVRAWRMLADGNPIDAARVQDLIEELAIAPETAHDFLQSVTERDGDGNIVGVLGLSLNDHAHGFIVNGVSFSTWCAVDTLFLPAMLGQPAKVKSVSPLSKKDHSPDGRTARRAGAGAGLYRGFLAGGAQRGGGHKIHRGNMAHILPSHIFFRGPRRSRAVG